MDNPCGGQSVFDFRITHGVSAADHSPRSSDTLCTAAENVGQNLQIEPVVGKPDNVECGFGLSSHGEDVAQRVGGSNLAKTEWVIDQRWKKIERLDDKKVVPQSVNSGITKVFRADYQIRIVKLR